MELSLKRQQISVSEVIYDAMTEQPLECDVLLPDACPDIQRILRCEVTPSLLACTVNGERLSLDGVAAVHLYYLDEEKVLRHTEYKIPYTKAVELRGSVQLPSVTVRQNVDYFNCRSVSARRLDMRGAVSIYVKVTGQNEEQILCEAQGAGVQLRHETVENTVVLPPAMRPITIREEVELGYGKPGIGAVIRCGTQANITDYRAIGGKLVTKGELCLKILYQCEEDEKKLDIMEYTLPISNVIDIDGVDEDCMCSAWYEVCTADISAKRDSGGESRIFVVEVSLNACAHACRKVTLEAVCDSYSTKYECKQTQKQVSFLRLEEIVSESCPCKEIFELPDKTDTVLDLWCKTGSATVRFEPDCAVVSGKFQICLFTSADDTTPTYYEQTREFTQKVSVKGGTDSVIFTPRIQEGAVSFTMNGRGKIEIRSALQIQGEIFRKYNKQVVSDLAVDESKPKAGHSNMLYLYYSAPQEPVWDIAKRYNTSVCAVRKENQLETDVLTEKMLLLIPME